MTPHVLLLLHGVATSCLLLYGMNCYVMLFLHRRAWRSMLQQDAAVQQAWHARTPLYPRVTVQLPVYNERYVIQRLIEAVVGLQYPRACLEIQILDDSTDETTAMAARLVERCRHGGFDITLHHRPSRQGYKAGALAEGLARATGEFIAIFDADFVPPPDFLLRTLPFLHDPTVAMVQARWGHVNREYSILTDDSSPPADRVPVFPAYASAGNRGYGLRHLWTSEHVSIRPSPALPELVTTPQIFPCAADLWDGDCPEQSQRHPGSTV